jgi:hypothetical protein
VVEDSIICNGTMVRVSANLLAFLQSIRHCSHVPWLWVDAILITEIGAEDIIHSDKNMPAIYRTATRTLCWTGLEYHSSLRKLITTTRQVGNHKEAIAECLLATDILHSAYKIRQSDMEVFQAATTLIDINT